MLGKLKENAQNLGGQLEKASQRVRQGGIGKGKPRTSRNQTAPRRPLLTEAEWRKNVGTETHPISLLHEYAVGLIWDMVHGSAPSPVRLPTLSGELSGDVCQWMEYATIPTAVNSFGGYIPDVAIYGKKHQVLRVIEVVGVNPTPAVKLKILQDNGIEVIQVPVRTEADFIALQPLVEADAPAWGFVVGGDLVTERADNYIREFMLNLERCSPAVRREMASLLAGIDSLESLYPLSESNPKQDAIE